MCFYSACSAKVEIQGARVRYKAFSYPHVVRVGDGKEGMGLKGSA